MIVVEIMEEDLPREEEGARHYFVEDEEEFGIEDIVDSKNTPPISQFLKLPQRIVNAPRVLHEPLVDYSRGQLLTLDAHIHNMQEIAAKKELVPKQKE